MLEADSKFEDKFKDDPDYELKKQVYGEIKELRLKYRAEGYRRFAFSRKVRDELKGKYGKDGNILRIIQIILSVLSIVLFFAKVPDEQS